jgi:hypothetical protein
MSPNGNRPGEGAAHSVGSSEDATECTSPPHKTQAPVGGDKRRPDRLRGFLLASTSPLAIHSALEGREPIERIIARMRGAL